MINSFRLAEPKLEVNPKDDLVLGMLADAHAVLGNHEQSVAYLQRLLAVSHSAVTRRY